MATVVSTGQITLVDLTDTTTYFYYSPNSDYSDASIVPGLNSKYIGIYSGEPISSGQPDPNWDDYNKEKYEEIKGKIVWSEYKGQPGETPVFDRTDKWYFLSDKPKADYTNDQLNNLTWGELNIIPDIKGSSSARYLLIRNQDHWKIRDETQSSDYYYDQSYIGADGADANVYEIVTDPEEIIRYTKPKSKSKDEYEVSLGNEIRIFLYKNKDEERQIIDIANFDLYLILDKNEYAFDDLNTSYGDIFYKTADGKGFVIEIIKILTNNENIDFGDNQSFIPTNYDEFLGGEDNTFSEFGIIKNFFKTITSSIIGLKFYPKGQKIETEEESNCISKKNILIRNAFTEDMANFHLYSNGITAAIRGTNLNFDETGITLIEGGLKIQKKETVKKEDGTSEEILKNVFYFDNVSKNLVLEGNIYAQDGFFSGIIDAKSGNFKGEITATGGTIGGFTIVNKDENNYLVSTDGAIKLDGKKGEIIANNIIIGTDATIANYIKIGNNSYIRNPSINENVFIESGNIKIYDSGIIEAGKININGNNSIINIGDSTNGGSIELNGVTKTLRSDSWEITSDKAIFNNITARGSLRAATFEYGKVQTVGGILFVKSSSTIKKIDGDIVTVECNENNLFDVNDLCCFSEILGMEILESSYIYKISEFINGNKVEFKLVSINEKPIDLDKIEEKLNASGSSLIGSPLFKLANTDEYTLVNTPEKESISNYYEREINTGKYSPTEEVELVEGKQYYIKNPNTNSEFIDNFAIGINSTSNDAFLPPQAISFNELIKDNQSNTYKYKTRMLLGDLKSVNYDGYGLYADNVYLEGRLVSQDSQNRLTAGINSKGQGEMPDGNKNYPWYNNGGKIILWGGSLQSSDATDAKFRVDDKGNLYASSGYFEGAIITKSIIEAAEIRTATISGIGTEKDKYGLILKDLKKGICFKGTDSNNNENIYFNLSNEVFETKDLNINFSFTSNNSKLSISKNGLNFDNIAKLGNIQIYKSKIGLDAISDLSKNSFEFKNDAFSIYDNIVKYKEGEGLKTNQTFSFSNKLFFDTNSGKTYMESYISESSTKGYDLYITE